MWVEDETRRDLADRPFDWLLAGIGGPEAGTIRMMRNASGQAIQSDVSGTFMNRCFNKDLEDPFETEFDAIVALSLDDTRRLAKPDAGCSVVAIAGGKAKVPAIQAVLQTDAIRQKRADRMVQVPGRLVNILITDELTALALLS